MKQGVFSKFILAGMCIFALAGCGQTNSDTSQTGFNSKNTNNSGETSSNNSKDNIMESANLIGDVVNISNNGCSVNQAKVIEGGAGMQTEADGYEDENNDLTINYNSDCGFLIAELSMTSGEVLNMSNGSISDVKKQSQIYVYGDFVDTHNFNADKVIIANWK